MNGDTAPVVVTPPAPSAAAAAKEILNGKPPEKPAEKPSEAPKVETQPDPAALKEQFGKLVQREKQTLAERQKLAEDRRLFEAERSKDLAEREDARKVKTWRENARKDPETAAKEIWGDDWFRHMSEFALEKRPPPDLRVDALREEVEKLRAEQSERDQKSLEEAKTREVQEQGAEIERFNSQVTAHVKAAGDKYELINMFGYHDHVHELIREHWNRQSQLPPNEKKLLGVDEAAQMVEDWRADEIEKGLKSKRLTAKLTSAQASSPKAPDGKQPEARTLDNGLTGTSSTAPKKRYRTEEERQRDSFKAYDDAVARRRKTGV